MIQPPNPWASFALLATVYFTIIHAIARAWSACLVLCKRVYIKTIHCPLPNPPFTLSVTTLPRADTRDAAFRAYPPTEPTLPITTPPSQLDSAIPSTLAHPNGIVSSTAVSASSHTSISSNHSTRSHPPQGLNGLEAGVLAEIGSIFSGHSVDDDLPDVPLP